MKNIVRKRASYIRILIAHVIFLILLFTVVLAVDAANLTSITILSPASGNTTDRTPSLNLSINGSSIDTVWISLDSIRNITYTHKAGIVNFAKLDLIFADDFSGYAQGSDGSPIWTNLPVFAKAEVVNETYMLYNQTPMIDALSSINNFNNLNYWMNSKVSVPSGYFGGAYLTPRFADVNSKYEIALDFDFSSININKAVNGTWSNLAALWTGSLNQPVFVSKGKWYNLGLKVSNNNITAFVNNQQALSVLDTDLNYTGVAIIAFDDNDTHKVLFDNISIYKELNFGQHTLNAYVNISNGSVYKQSVSFFVVGDNISPVINTGFNITSPKLNDVINFTGNITDDAGLLSENITYNISGALTKINFTLSGSSIQVSNATKVTCGRGCVINFTMYAADNSGNMNQNSTLITVANTPPIAPTILFPATDLKTNQQSIDLNVTFSDADNDIINIRYYINGRLNQTSASNTTFNASDGFYILNVSLYDGIDSSANSTINFTLDTTKPTVILDKPSNNYHNDTDLYVNITFNGTAADNIELKNATLYHNISGIWKGNLSSVLSGISAGFKFSLNLTNATFIWNVEACDAAGNCNFSATNRTVILNFTGIANVSNITSAAAFSVLNFTPANNSLNVSLKQDITATFNQDANDSTIDNSTVIVKDSSNNAVKGEINYFSAERRVRFNPDRFLKENETYRVNLSTGIKSQNGDSIGSDFIWKFTTEMKDTDKDGIFDIDDTDDDNDGINDSEDFLKGNASNIKTDIVGLGIEVNESTNLSKKFDKQELVKFFVNNSVVIELNFSFGQSNVLDLTNISVQQNDNSSKGSIIINSLIVNNTLKTFYLDNLSSYDGICIKDADVDAISDMSNDCKSAFETFIACPGSAKNYDCSINGTRLKLTGLNHSGAQQANDNAPPRIDLMSISYSGTSTVSAALTVITDEDASCKFDEVDVPFSNMGSSMSGSGTQHTGSRSYSADTSGTYYVLCRDSFGNTMPSSSSISFNADATESSGSETAGGGSGGGGGGGSFLNFSICKENWVCDNWNECKNDFQTRKCLDLNNCGAKNQKPKEFQSCKKACEEIWQCNQWSICSDGISKRECYDLSECGTEDLKPSEYEECKFIAECYNLVQDRGEEGIDCGGACPACETCFDRVQNQGEEGIDCGAPCRPCRTGDVITGKNILVFSEAAPKASLMFIFVIVAVVVSLFLVFKGVHTFKDAIKKSGEYRKDKKNYVISKLKDKHGISKMMPLTLENTKKAHTYKIKKSGIEEIKAKPYKTTATGSSKDKILNVLKEMHQNGR